jgi:transposase-like protein
MKSTSPFIAKKHCAWRAVAWFGGVLEGLAQRRRDRQAAQSLVCKWLKKVQRHALGSDPRQTPERRGKGGSA